MFSTGMLLLLLLPAVPKPQLGWFNQLVAPAQICRRPRSRTLKVLVIEVSQEKLFLLYRNNCWPQTPGVVGVMKVAGLARPSAAIRLLSSVWRLVLLACVFTIIPWISPSVTPGA